MRLDQCSLIDKYVDSRTEDYQQERQSCVRKSIDQNGGNMEQAMESCRSNNMFQADLADWSGSSSGQKVSANRLIDSSAKWAKLDDSSSKSSLNLLKSLVGDTVVNQGRISVEYGPRATPLSPRTYLQSVEKQTYGKLCADFLRKVDYAGPAASFDRVVSDKDIKSLNPDTGELLVDRQTLRSLAMMNVRQREIACKRLSDSMAMTQFSMEVNRSLDILTVLLQNPNLPPQRKAELEEKRKALKEQVEMTVTLQRQQNEPLNNVVSQINSVGDELRSEGVGQGLNDDMDRESSERAIDQYMNCSDNVMCRH